MEYEEKGKKKKRNQFSHVLFYTTMLLFIKVDKVLSKSHYLVPVP